MGTIDVPIFYGEGDDLLKWVMWIDDFASDQSFTDFETLRFAYGFIEGEALRWYGHESLRSVFRSWANLKLRLLMRFCKRPTQQEVTNLQERLRQIGHMLDRWDEEDEAKKQQKEEAMTAGDLNRTLSFVEGSVESVEWIPPVTVSEVATVVCVEAGEEEEQRASMEIVFQKIQPDELSGNTRKKKKRWKTPLEMQRSLDTDLGFDKRRLFGYVDSKGKFEQLFKGGNETEAESYTCQVFDTKLDPLFLFDS